MSTEQIAAYRRRYAELVDMMNQPKPWDRTTMLACVGEAFGGAKLIPTLLDEIERLQAAAHQAAPTEPDAQHAGEGES